MYHKIIDLKNKIVFFGRVLVSGGCVNKPLILSPEMYTIFYSLDQRGAVGRLINIPSG